MFNRKLIFSDIQFCRTPKCEKMNTLRILLSFLFVIVLPCQIEGYFSDYEDNNYSEFEGFCNITESDLLPCVRVRTSYSWNLYAAMNGYDIGRSNPYDANGDPAIKSRIFQHECMGGFREFIAESTKVMNCRADFSTKTISTSQEYKDERSSSNSFSVSAELSGHVGFMGVHMDASASLSTDKNSDEQASESVFSVFNGSIVLAKAKCHTNTVSISRFVRPVFTPNFIRALEAMEYAIDSTSILHRTSTFRAFLQEFGTHYNIRSHLGSELLYEQRFADETNDNTTSYARSDCTKVNAQASVSVGYGMSYLEANGAYDNSACNSNKHSEDFHKQTSTETTRTISRGSKPKSLDEWIDSEFTPVVIQAELDEIPNLLKNSWLTNETGYGIRKSIDGEKVKDFYLTMMQFYCSLNLPNATGILQKDNADATDDDVDNKCNRKLWAALDTNKYKLAHQYCEKLIGVEPLSITLNGVKQACRTIPGCNIIEFNEDNNHFDYYKCPIPLPLSESKSETGIHVYGHDYLVWEKPQLCKTSHIYIIK